MAERRAGARKTTCVSGSSDQPPTFQGGPLGRGSVVSKSKAKGTSWEVRVRDFLRLHGHPNAERLPSEGAKDRGDISGVPGWVVECKNHRAVDLAGWCDEAEKEAMAAHVYRWAVVFPRKAHQTRKAYAVIPLWLLADLMTRPENKEEGAA